jgi:hypothetical protein
MVKKKTRLRSQGLEAASRKLAEQQGQRSFQCGKVEKTEDENVPQSATGFCLLTAARVPASFRLLSRINFTPRNVH